MQPNLPEAPGQVGLRSMEPRPVGKLPHYKVQTENHGDCETGQGQGQLDVANRASGHQRARTRQGEIGGQTTPGSLAAKRSAWSRSESTRLNSSHVAISYAV